jgi:DNA primase
MGIVDEDVVRVREAADLVSIASQHMALKKVGRRYVGLCPFHAEKTPSFTINGEAGLYKCFGCQAGGDVITFVREVEHVDFVGAVEFLAGRTGIQLRYTERAESRERQRRASLVAAMAKAVDWYHERLLTAPDANRARGYLRSRGYDGEVVRRFHLGWAPDDWDALAKALRLPDDVLRDTGLGFINRRQRQQDAFRGRVLFPIFDAQGDPVAFGGRSLPDAEGPKYKNSPETPIYHKSRVLYGLNWAKTPIVEADQVIVCEGYTDVIGFALAGVPRAVATCGTALTEEHVRAMRRFARHVVLAFDADAAGQAAAERIYEWERKHEVGVSVAALPSGTDPGDLARTDPAALAKAVENASPFLAFRVDRALTGARLDHPEGRAAAAEAALDVIREHPSDLVRDQYVMQVADRCRLDPERLREQLRRGPRARVEVERPRPRPVEKTGPALEALRLAVHRPADVADHLDEVLFEDELYLAAFRALAASETLHDAIERADPRAADLLQRLAVEDTDAEPADVIARLVDDATTRALIDIEAEARHSPEPLEYAQLIGWAKLRVEELRDPATSLDAATQLVAWLTERGQEGR